MNRLRVLVWLSSVALLATPLFAQGGRGGGGRGFGGGGDGPPNFPTNDAVIRRLWTLGMDSSQVWPLSQTLFDSIGPLLHGTPAIKSAHDWIMSKYQQWGITARNEQYGTWMGWRRGVTHVDLTKPRLRTLEAMALAMSAPTRGEVTGSVVVFPDVPDARQFAAWLPSAKGKFVAISPAQPTCRPDDEWQAMALPGRSTGCGRRARATTRRSATGS